MTAYLFSRETRLQRGCGMHLRAGFPPSTNEDGSGGSPSAPPFLGTSLHRSPHDTASTLIAAQWGIRDLPGLCTKFNGGEPGEVSNWRVPRPPAESASFSTNSDTMMNSETRFGRYLGSPLIAF